MPGPAMAGADQRLVVWGTYDTGKPRVRLLLEGARQAGFEVVECHGDIWSGVEDKSQLHTSFARLRRLSRWLLAYPGLIVRYLRLPKHRSILVPYLGLFDVLVLLPFARLRRARIVWDVFLPLYDMVVEDRRLISSGSIFARVLFLLEWLASRSCDALFLDTATHARAFEDRFSLEKGSVGDVPVGAEEQFVRMDWQRRSARPTILFYGQFIPLHGLDTMLEAARRLLAKRPDVLFRIIGQGQEAPRIDALLEANPIPGLERISWLAYDQLPSAIAESWVCLGIFGTSQKAARVIPNKVYQILAVGRPLITLDSPAIGERFEPGPALRLVPAGDALALEAEMHDVLEKAQADDSRLAEATASLPFIGASQIGEHLRLAVARPTARMSNESPEPQ